MARQITYSIGVINITVQPHSPEKYMRCFVTHLVKHRLLLGFIMEMI